VWEKVQEEIAELKYEVDNCTAKEKIEGEFGDVLFSLINYARFLDINAEDALEKTNKKFIKRFQYLEVEAGKIGKQLSEMTLAEMDVYWNKAKEL
ncbi:MAG: nucleoside triphosphate pyrophosphohydrolase, partial [Bacteroidetes bacterium]|nr:nucleoside triphosphate pyrophosphohydrolase [Bacteroidota bacterium]